MRPKIDITRSAHYTGDCRKLLARLPDACVQSVITSPPYWGLRDYKVRGQIGLERTPEAYVQVLVEVFREVRRVLRPDGTLWLNLGDCYITNPRGSNSTRRSTLQGRRQQGVPHPHNLTRDPRVRGRSHAAAANRGLADTNLKHKDLVGIPWMVAFALRADGWRLRMDVIWSKPNPTPENVHDRPTRAHEYLFLLTRSSRYFYDADAIAEPAIPGSRSGNRARRRRSDMGGVADHDARQGVGAPWSNVDGSRKRNKRSVWTVATARAPKSRGKVESHFAVFPEKLIEPCVLAGARPGQLVLDPFSGSGTVGRVAERHNRLWIGFDLNHKYRALADRRTAQRSLDLARRLV